MYFVPLSKQNQAEVWPRFQSLLKLLLWTKGVEWVKVLDALSPLCLWQCFLLLQSQFSIFWSGSHSSMVAAAAVLNSSPTVGGDGGNILWALCCIFGQFPSAQPSLSLANILLCSHHCHHPKFYRPPLIRRPEREAVVGTDFQIVASATKTHSQSQYWTECRAVVQFCKQFHVKY